MLHCRHLVCVEIWGIGVEGLGREELGQRCLRGSECRRSGILPSIVFLRHGSGSGVDVRSSVGLMSLGALAVEQTIFPQLDALASRISKICEKAAGDRDAKRVEEAHRCRSTLLVSE